MNLKRVLTFALLALLGTPLASAQAYWRVGIGIGVPVWRPHYRVYVAPAPVLYVAPAPVYVQPVPVYVQPAPVVQPVPLPPSTIQAPPVQPSAATQTLPAQPVPVQPPN
jgi:hypothetical protein